jgi:hypothetical protein
MDEIKISRGMAFNKRREGKAKEKALREAGPKKR